jgi:hypothetical protein
MNHHPLDYSEILKPEQFSIELLWKAYASAVIPKSAPPIQFSETRLAFYAGFLECFKVVTDYASGLEEDEACKLLSAINDESRRFVKELNEDHRTPKN